MTKKKRKRGVIYEDDEMVVTKGVRGPDGKITWGAQIGCHGDPEMMCDEEGDDEDPDDG